MTEASVPRNRGVRMLNKDTEPWNGGYALTGKRKRRVAISVFGTAFLVFFGVGFSIPVDVHSPAPLKLTNAPAGAER